MNQTSTVVVLFADLVESTALMTAIGDDDADRVRRELFTRARAAIDGCRGTLVKTYGDGLMAVFPAGAGDAVRCAENLRDEARAIESARPLQLRVGIAAGEASEEDGDWFGTPVVEASRLCAAADPDEVLLSETARKLIGSRGGHEFTEVGRLTLKGLAHPLPAFALGTTARRRRERHRGRWAVAAGLVVVLVAAGVVVVTAGSGDESSGVATPAVPQPQGYTPKLVDRECTPEEAGGDTTVTCQTLVVPEDRAHPHSRMVRLPIVSAPATNADASDVPMIVAAFGPASLAGDPLRAAAPQVLLGIRGEPGSEPSLACPEVDASRETALGLPWDDAQALYWSDLTRCLHRLHDDEGIDLAQYDYGDVADDVRDLALALGHDTVTLRSAGEPSRAASVVLVRYPGLVQGALFTNPFVPPTNVLQGIGQRADQSLALLADRCSHDPVCNAATPDLVGQVHALVDEMAAAPQTVPVDSSAGPVDVYVDAGRLATALFLGIGDAQDVLALLPSVVADRNLTTAAGYLVDTLPRVEAGPRVIAEWCAEAAGVLTPTQLEAESRATPTWASLVPTSALDVCDDFGIERVPDLTTEPSSTVPVFVIHGVMTTWAPTRAMVLFTAGLSDADLLSLPNHAVDQTGWPDCVFALRARFTRTPHARLDAESCAAHDPPIPFVAG